MSIQINLSRKFNTPFSKHKFNLLLLGFLLVFQINSGAATFDNNKPCRIIYSELFKLHLTNARTLIAEEIKQNPENVYVYSLDGYVDFLEVFLNERQDLLEKYKTDTELRLALLKTGNTSSPYFLLTQAEIILQRGLVRTRFKETFNAAVDFRRAYKLLVENRKKFPDFKLNLKSLGLLHSVIGAIPQNYQWAVKLAGMKGTIKKGTGELHDLLNSTQTDADISYLKNEILIYLIFIESHLSKDKAESLRLITLYDKNISSQLITFSLVNTYYVFDKNDLVIQTLDQQKPDADAIHMFYLNYIHGVSKLNRLDSDADVAFKYYAANYPGKSFIKSSYQKLAWHALAVKSDRKLYDQYLANCNLKGDDFSDEDKQAKKEFDSKEVPNIFLLRARLLYDGGYFKQALNEIANKEINNFPTIENKIELVYRTARIFDALENDAKAIELYKKTIELGSTLQYYFAANSALNIGLIYEKQKDIVNAELFFRKCIAMRDHEYQNSIDQKAKAGLNRIGKE